MRGASGRMPLPRAGHPTARAVKASAPLKTAARRPLVVVVVVVVAATPNYLRQASQNMGGSTLTDFTLLTCLLTLLAPCGYSPTRRRDRLNSTPPAGSIQTSSEQCN